MARKAVLVSWCLAVLLILGCQQAGEQAIRVPIQDGLDRCDGESFKIDLLNALDALPDQPADARTEQLRDWVWRTVLARLATQGSGSELLASVAKQPLWRDESLAHILDIPVGRSRAAVDKNGTVYVLVDRSLPHRTREDVLEAIDQEALVLGAMPKAVVVYGVAFHMSTAEAEVCRLGSFDQDWMRAPRQGFRQANVASAEGLGSFLEGGVDLLSATCRADGETNSLELTGRVRARAASAPATVEHIAALRMPPGYVPVDDLPVEIPPEARTQASDLGAQIDEALRLMEEQGAPLPQGQDASSERLLARLLEWKKQYPEVATADLLLSLQAQTSGIDNLGFSLDPRTDTAHAVALLDQLLGSKGASARSVRTPLQELRNRVAHADRREGERLLLEAEMTGGPVTSVLVQSVLEKSRYQCARYDGPVAGTNSAMTMFYTDLIAKLWAINWKNIAPTDLIPGFVSVPEHHGASTYCEGDDGVPYTRIWFGSRQEGFIRDLPGKLRFAPNATRLFALGSVAGPDYSAEVEPSAQMLRFIRWWDRNYSSVADWEPQYELLNQLVKWTLVQRMAQGASSDCLSFLDDAQVEKSERFDSWLARQKHLRWRGPLPAVHKSHEKTECLKLFKSAWFGHCGNLAMLSGGVGLPTSEEYASRPVRRLDPQPFLRPLDPENQATRSADGHLRYPSIQRPKGSLEEVDVRITADRAQLSAKLRSSISLRGDFLSRLVDKAGDSYRWLDYRQEDRLVDGNNGLESQETLEGFGVVRLSATDLQKGRISLTVSEGVETKANRIAQGIELRQRYGKDDVPTASQEVAGDLPVFDVSPNEAVVYLRAEGDGEGVYAVMSSGGGNRGPPTGGGRWIIGNPEGPRRRWNEGRRNPHRAVGVALLPEKEGKDYIDRQGAEPVKTSDPVVLDVREKLRRGDLEGAQVVAETPGASTWAVATVALHAIEHRRFGVAERLVRRLPGEGQAIAELRRIQRALMRAQAELARTEPGSQAHILLQKAQVVAAFKADRLSLADAERWLAREGEGSESIRIVSEQFKDAKLPPVAHGLGEAGATKDQFVVDVIAQAELAIILAENGKMRTHIPSSIELDGIPLVVREMPAAVSAGGRPGGAEGFPSERIPPIVFIRRCSTEGEGERGLPYCFRSMEGRVIPLGSPGPTDPGSGLPLDILLADCDEDGDGSLNKESEKDCAEERTAEAEPLQDVASEP